MLIRLALLAALAGCSGSVTVTPVPPPLVHTNVTVLSWSIPTTRTDGTPLTDLSGFQVYYGTASGQYATVVIIADPATTSFELDDLASGTYFFAATAYDASALQSAFSNEASKVIP
jgi:hypothetical protein